MLGSRVGLGPPCWSRVGLGPPVPRSPFPPDNVSPHARRRRPVRGGEREQEDADLRSDSQVFGKLLTTKISFLLL